MSNFANPKAIKTELICITRIFTVLNVVAKMSSCTMMAHASVKVVDLFGGNRKRFLKWEN